MKFKILFEKKILNNFNFLIIYIPYLFNFIFSKMLMHFDLRYLFKNFK